MIGAPPSSFPHLLYAQQFLPQRGKEGKAGRCDFMARERKGKEDSPAEEEEGERGKGSLSSLLSSSHPFSFFFSLSEP